ncbi:aminoglycoside phosphotransferase [Kribbella capetownensis]|uniref:Aminoglycoside phosphotransferase n=1 Tax=Kribbella capetownensis TaxID=1572659 RepID=A0A4R0JLH9_9ACTN|nr:phosphotransferase [Kribbella capetownensis]TCC46694.1 aminoglycoside phosphotransferase [Kribbella capetownensis]
MLPAWLSHVDGPVLRATEAPSIEALHGELLRQWGSSEVWRLSYGLRSVIVKRGTDSQSGEGTAYERFVIPLGLPAPELIHAEDGMLVLADVGRVTLEQEPSAEGFLAAAELLAEIRSRAVSGPSGFPPQRVKELADRIERISFDVGPLTEALAALHRDAPFGVVHGDFVPKNLVTDGTRWTAVDWPLAYVAPYLSDLYTLVRDATALGHDRGPIVAHYVEIAGADPFLVDRQLLAGGACFCLLALDFVVTEGQRTIPDSGSWIAPLLAELEDLLDQLS